MAYGILLYKSISQKGDKMRKTGFLYFLIPLLFLNITGCVFILGGAAGAIGAYGVGKDTIRGETDKPYDALWSAALTVGRIRGRIKQEDRRGGYIELEIDSSRVWIRFIRLTRATTRLRISARKFHFPNLNLAQELYVKIIEEAR
jgi:hypothetical protein